MATELTPTGETLAINALTGGTTYVALFTSAATTNPPNVEVTGGSYARQLMTSNWTNAGSNPTVASNTAIVTFPSATANWGTVNQFAIMDALTAGNMRGWGDLASPKVINNGDTARFAAGTLTISVT
jgi:hypothetical protein